MATNTPTRRATLLVAAYSLWLALSVLVGWLLLLLPGLLTRLTLLVGGNPWVIRAVRQLSFPLLGVAWLVWIFWLEWYLRRGTDTGLLRPRATRLLIITGVLALLLLGLRALVGVEG